MLTKHRHITPLFVMILGSLLAVWGCKDRYVSPYKSPVTGYLVVEGYISGNTVTRFTLSRSIPLPGDTTLPTENGATVLVRGSDNSSYPLTGMGNGVYSSIDTLALNPQLQYGLSIQTAAGEKYQSDLVPFKPTPPIDSLNFVVNADHSIDIDVSTHDPANNTHYYQWNWDNSWEYFSADDSYVYWDEDTVPPAVVLRPPDDQVYQCWTSGSSTNIVIGNSTKLASDVIYELPVNLIGPNSVETSVKYTILVRQYALTADGYTFLSLMQKNTESLGSVFDEQPTQLTGNVHCLTNPSELVIGYVSAGTVQQQRLWITRSQIPSDYSFSCPNPDTAFPNDEKVDQIVFGLGGWTPLYWGILPSERVGWVSNSTFCLDCTTRGGSNQRPAFWIGP